MLLHEIIDNAAAAAPGREAIIDGERRWTFAQLAGEVHGLAARIATVAPPGSTVAVLSENSADYVAALYAVPAARCVLLHCNTRHTPEEIAATLERGHASVLLGSEDELARLEHSDTPRIEDRVLLGSADRRPSDSTGSGDSLAAAPIDQSSMAWLMYTSGTTGAPKGVMLTHRSLIAAVLNTTMCRSVGKDEVYLYPFPLFHVAAYNVLHMHMRHRPVVLLARFEATTALEAIRDEAVTSVSLAPTMLAMLLDHPDRDDSELSTLRTISYGAAAMPLELLRRCTQEWPAVGLAQGYGMTELSGNAVFLGPDDHRLAATERPELLSAAGKPAPMTALRIVSSSGKDVVPGDPGEILVKGDQVCAGYLDDPTATTDALSDGWLHTGDIGRIDAEGYLHVVDRLKDIIITGGENVSSREVEDALSVHPAVAAVAVIGTPDARWGELVTAVVVPRDGAEPDLESLRETCSTLAGFKHPRRLVLVSELPTNASGKVDKVALRSISAGSSGDAPPRRIAPDRP